MMRSLVHARRKWNGVDEWRMNCHPKPEQSLLSLLLQTVRHENGLEMPTDGKLSAVRIEAFSRLIRAGVVWPDASESPPSGSLQSNGIAAPRPSNGSGLAAAVALRRRRSELTKTKSARSISPMVEGTTLF